MNAEENELDLYTLLNAGLSYYRDGRPYEAHEVWEYAWGAEVGRNKLALQALIQVAAALYKHDTGNPRGTSKLLAKAKDKIAEVLGGASSWLGIDFVALQEDVTRALTVADQAAAIEAIGIEAIGVEATRGAQDLPRPSLPERVGPDGVLYLHGFASGPTSHKASVIVPPLVARGLHVAVPDLNEGDFSRLTVSRGLALARRHLRDRTLVIGSSMGGYLAALLAARDERVKGLILLAPAFDFAERMRVRYGDQALEAWSRHGTVEVDHHGSGRKQAIAYSLFEDARTYPGRPPIRVPTWVLQGARDDVVPARMVREVVSSFPSVELVEVDDDHGLTASADLARDAALRFAARLGLAPNPPTPDRDAVLRQIEG